MQQLLPRASFHGRYGVTPWRSLGAFTPQQSQAINVGGGVVAAGATAIIGSIASAGGSILGLSPAATSALVPVVGPIIAGAVFALQTLIANSGCGQTCIETSQWANQAAEQLQTVLDGYFALPAPRTVAQQTVALAAFDSVWAQLKQLCGQAGTGNAGVRCISDRQRGACTWKQAYAPKYPGEPGLGTCWNWFNGYRDPIANDPVVPDPTPTLASDLSTGAAAAGDVLSQAGASISNVLSGVSPLLLIGGALVVLALSGGKD